MKDKKDLIEIERRLSFVEAGIKRLDKSIRDLKLELIRSRKDVKELLALMKGDDGSEK